MKRWELKAARGFDPKTQKTIGLYASQLNDQLERLRRSVEVLSVKQLEWQAKPGMNTVGMLLAHMAFAELWRIRIAPHEIPWEPQGRKMLAQQLGVRENGIPLATDGSHPSCLKGMTADKYISILDKSRRTVIKEMKTWKDGDLDELFMIRDVQVSRAVTLYHMLEHFCGHHGQILLLLHMMRDAGVLKSPRMKS